MICVGEDHTLNQAKHISSCNGELYYCKIYFITLQKCKRYHCSGILITENTFDFWYVFIYLLMYKRNEKVGMNNNNNNTFLTNLFGPLFRIEELTFEEMFT